MSIRDLNTNIVVSTGAYTQENSSNYNIPLVYMQNSEPVTFTLLNSATSGVQIGFRQQFVSNSTNLVTLTAQGSDLIYANGSLSGYGTTELNSPNILLQVILIAPLTWLLTIFD